MSIPDVKLMVHVKAWEGMLESSWMFLIQIVVFQFRPPIGNLDFFGLIDIPYGESKLKHSNALFWGGFPISVVSCGWYSLRLCVFPLHGHRIPHPSWWKGLWSKKTVFAGSILYYQLCVQMPHHLPLLGLLEGLLSVPWKIHILTCIGVDCDSWPCDVLHQYVDH